ncbi:5-formyltetrahydrofolate cyclo-ligase [Sphingobacterium allocomposti]|uniref:5-formyltetrahydrofolate cyclo-ligase n=1 Tax=Sphingobacterium allocomposti TaxID=415956 RepID=A0A5S5D448_9SPHI|nr:5-formyltetrahydrofolate cyclo-ligase [Sphingobacterium composti Yoo et al. 2007 non Ten et al. 2007]TYP90038.1 5-formyltetrahydrofolate cyclo-ligase [Sphingobacterium composti Yoo et al. 2007 non Ten et al. 2007]
MTKGELRAYYRDVRMSMTAADISLFNVRILSHLLRMDWRGVEYVHCFLPIVRHKEPDMWAFMETLQEQYPDIKIVVSRSSSADFSMANFLFSKDLLLCENKWGILEPIDGERVDESLLDVVLVPLLVADQRGNRVGYGKGFYDRFLVRCRPDCIKVGVTYFDPVDKIDDVDAWDIPLNQLITPSSVYRF